MIKLVMISIHKILIEKACETKMILQVHDELDEVKVLLKSEMEKVLSLEASVKVDDI